MRTTPLRKLHRRPIRTRLDRFIKKHRIQPKTLAEEAGVTRQHVCRLRTSNANPTLTAMLTLRDTCRRITGLRVRVTDLFDLGEG